MRHQGIQVEEQEPAVVELAQQVQKAEVALLEWLETHKDKASTPRDVQTETQNGWPASVVSIAFWRLVNSGRIELDERGQVRSTEPAGSV